MSPSASELSRVVSHALRHAPWIYELELDDEGWVPIELLLVALRELGPAWAGIDRADVEQMIERSLKRRHELAGERIRALYGHSVPRRLVKIPGGPPDHLFHGTSPSAWAAIEVCGLWPMGRQYVHLSIDAATAEQVGRRKCSRPVVLTIRAGDAHDAGLNFLVGNEVVWLAESVPAEFIALID